MLDVKIPIFDAVGTGENITKLRKQKHLSVRERQCLDLTHRRQFINGSMGQPCRQLRTLQF